MSTLIVNLPAYEVWVRKEYLTDHQSGHGEFVKGVWVTAKSIPGRASILRLIYQNTLQSMISYQFLLLYRLLRLQNLI